MRKDIFNIDNRDKTMIVKECEKCNNLTMIEKDWLRFIIKIKDKVKCVNCLFPEWSFIRSPMRIFICSKCCKLQHRSDRCLDCKREEK